MVLLERKIKRVKTRKIISHNRVSYNPYPKLLHGKQTKLGGPFGFF
jgi:hypothetical protein